MFGMTVRPDLAQRMARIAPFEVMEVLDAARRLEASGRDVIHLEVGEPDFPTPPPVIAAAQRALATRPMFYTSAVGMPELREAISRWYQATFRVTVPMERIIVTAGQAPRCSWRSGRWLTPANAY